MGKKESVQACDDFYSFANGKWIAKDAPIPKGYSSWGSTQALREKAMKDQIKLLAALEAKEGASLSKDEAKIVAIAQASQNRFTAWKAKKEDLSELIEQVNQVESFIGDLEDHQAYMKGLGKVLAECQLHSVASPVIFSAETSFENPGDMVLTLQPGGLSMPTRDHYLSNTFKLQRAFFQGHLNNIVKIIGKDNLVDNFAHRVYCFETKLAMIMMTPAQMSQFTRFYTKTTLDTIAQEANTLASLPEKGQNFAINSRNPLSKGLPGVLQDPRFGMRPIDQEAMDLILSTMAEILGLREAMQANCKKHYPKNATKERMAHLACFDGDYFRRLFPLLMNPADRQDAVAYFQYQVISASRELTSKAIDEEFFKFYNRELLGESEQDSDERRSVSLVNQWAGMLFGKLYVKQHFSSEDKKNLDSMVKELLAVMETSLSSLDWMTPATRKKALEKLRTLTAKIGYPDTWENFDTLDVKSGETLLEISKKVSAFRTQKDLLEVINAPKNTSKWLVSPQSVNAFYDPQSNEICFPAAILQAPFYFRDSKALEKAKFDLGDISPDTPGLLDAINCGGICSVIAHEMGHGFGQEGSQFDASGNPAEWWSKEDYEQFNAKCILMAKQVLQWKLTDDKGVTHQMHPELVMSQCLADITGISLSMGVMMRKLGHASSKRKSLVGALVKRKSSRAGKDAHRLDHIRAFCRAWATIWRYKSTTANAVKMASLGAFVAPPFRANLLKNLPEFYEAFDIPEGSDMYIPPQERVALW